MQLVVAVGFVLVGWMAVTTETVNSERFKWLSGQIDNTRGPTVHRINEQYEVVGQQRPTARRSTARPPTDTPLQRLATRPVVNVVTATAPPAIAIEDDKSKTGEIAKKQQPPKLPKIPRPFARMLGLEQLGLPAGLIESSDFPAQPTADAALAGTAAAVQKPPTGFAFSQPQLQQFAANAQQYGIADQFADLIRRAQNDAKNGAAISPDDLAPESLDAASLLRSMNPAFTNPGGFFNQDPAAASSVDEGGFLGMLGNIARQIAPGGLSSVLSEGTAGNSNAFSSLFAAMTDFVNLREPKSNSVQYRPIKSDAKPATPDVGGASPPVAGVPRLPGLNVLDGGIPRTADGDIDVFSLASAIASRVTNGTTIADVIPASNIQKVANNITSALLPETPDVDLEKFMGRWFEGITSPRATVERCVVHHYGGLTNSEKTATFTALKIYREGTEFGQVRYSVGYAFRSGQQDGMLQMHQSDQADASPFWIYKVGPEEPVPDEVQSSLQSGNQTQYAYAVISNWVKYPTTVLVRDPDTYAKYYQKEVLDYLKEEGFLNGFTQAFNMLQPANYQHCRVLGENVLRFRIISGKLGKLLSILYLDTLLITRAISCASRN